MCIPAAVLAVGSLIATAVSTTVTGIGQAKQAEAARSQADYQAEIAEYEAALAQQNRDSEAVRHGISARIERARFRNIAFASGRDPNSVSFRREADTAEMQYAFDSDAIVRRGDARVLGLQLRARGERSRGRAASAFAKYAIAGTAISGAASLAVQGYGFGSELGWFGGAPKPDLNMGPNTMRDFFASPSTRRVAVYGN